MKSCLSRLPRASRLSLLIGSTLVLAACNSTAPNKTISNEVAFAPRADNAFLAQTQAQYRATRVSEVNYALDFNLSNASAFSATAELAFQLSGVTHPITIDLNKATILAMKVNGNPVTPTYNQSFITVDPQYLHNGSNIITLEYKREHSTNGEGLHRFVDPADGKVYLYSHFEPAAANQMFPSFDQPDLKATYKVSVTAPQDWHVISTLKESSITPMGDKRRWVFGQTPKLSTYNFSLHAGPYQMWQDESGKYPARLFVRQSVASQVSPADWFKYTKMGLTFFDQYFGIDYPFKKYDQLLVPDFLYGAMENAAAVTFSEGAFLSNGKMALKQEQRLASVILHEMAHQWFGDLVTMKWWNGLWLNESFAAFMATLATAEATPFDYAWRTFYSGEKQRAYAADQRVTTHPIEVPVPSTANAFDNIDAITYSKGASTLQQLRHLLTPEVFREGVHRYLVKYSYKNATLDDFIDTLSATAQRDLSQWKQQWLYQPGVNTIKVNYQCNNDTISAFTIEQSASEQYPVLREQRINIGLFNQDSQGQLQLSQASPIIYIGKTTQASALIGSRCPDLVYPNYQDWAFVKVNLDSRSFATAKTALSKVADPLLRSMLWQSMWDSVQDGLLPLNEFLDVAMDNISTESDYTLLNQVLNYLDRSLTYLNRFGTQTAEYKSKIDPLIEDLAWRSLTSGNNNPDNQRAWFDAYVRYASTPQALNQLSKLLAGDLKVADISIDQDIRWQIIQTLNQFDVAGSLALIDAELVRDNSDNGQKQALAAKVIRPDLEQKGYWIGQFISATPEVAFPKLRIAMSTIYPSSQSVLEEQSAEQILSTLATVDASKGPVFMRSYAANLIPDTCTAANLVRLDKVIAKDETNKIKLSTGTKRFLLAIQQNNQRCLKVAKAMTAH